MLQRSQCRGMEVWESVKTTSPIPSDYEDVDVYGESIDLEGVGESSLAYETEHSKVSNYEAGKVPHYGNGYDPVVDEPYGNGGPEALEFQFVYGGDYEAARKLPRDETRCDFKKKAES